jgi:parallel beta-helix repeat protein
MIPALLALCSAATSQGSDWVGKTRYYAARDDQAVYEVREDNIVLDFKGGGFQSGKPVNPDQNAYTGTGLLLEGRKNVTIRNLKVRGYRFNIRLVNCQNIRLENCKASGSRSIRMAQGGLPMSTFLDIRNIDVWRTYGAGIWIENSKKVVLKKSSARGSQNGLVLVDTSDSTIIENDFTFNSGWGIALGRSSDNAICWNKADFCNRPWAGGWGGDSSAVAVADSSNRNYFVGNSMTHSGDGFFLTHKGDRFDEKTGKIELFGPSNDNVIAYNDGSWSTANAFEGTFSTGNVYYKNWANDSLAAGFWLGYSDDSLVLANEVLRNANSGVAIEHGRQNVVEANRIEGSAWAGIAFWAAEDWRAKAKPSERNDALGNKLKSNQAPYDLRGTSQPYLKDEVTQEGPGSVASAANPNTTGRRAKFETEQLPRVKALMAMRPKAWKFYRETQGPKGVGWIQAEDWAPRDFFGNLAAWRQPDPGSLEMYLTELGTRVAAPSFVRFEPTPDNPFIVRISAKADPKAPGMDMPLGVNLSSANGKRRQLVKATLRTGLWQVSWFEWLTLKYEDEQGWKDLFGGDPLWKQNTRLLGGDFTGKSPGPGLPNHHFACVAKTKFKTEGGRYIFSTLSDDGIRLFVDGKELISRWNHHGPTADEAAITLNEGVHDIRVEYCQESGAAVLQVNWRRT